MPSTFVSKRKPLMFPLATVMSKLNITAIKITPAIAMGSSNII